MPPPTPCSGFAAVLRGSLQLWGADVLSRCRFPAQMKTTKKTQPQTPPYAAPLLHHLPLRGRGGLPAQTSLRDGGLGAGSALGVSSWQCPRAGVLGVILPSLPCVRMPCGSRSQERALRVLRSLKCLFISNQRPLCRLSPQDGAPQLSQRQNDGKY